MSQSILEACLVIALLLNFYILATARLKLLIAAVAAQGALLGLLYPVAHRGFLPDTGGFTSMSTPELIRLLLLTLVIIGIKAWLIPKFLYKAVILAGVRPLVTSVIGFIPSLLLGAIATVAALLFAGTLPGPEFLNCPLLIPASLATVLCGFIMLCTRREALAQVLGYIVLENGIFIFGLLLIEPVPLLVEFGVVLDLFVGVFVMGIIINHVSRAFPEASTEHLTHLKE